MTRDEIADAVSTVQASMGLNHWEITVSFTCTDDAFAKCVPEPQYWRADISFNLDKCKGDREIIRKCIVHEMIHAVLSPYTMAAQHFAGPLVAILDELEESVVTQIENWPLWDYTEETEPNE